MYLISIYVFSPGGGGPLCSGLVLRTPHLNYCGWAGIIEIESTGMFTRSTCLMLPHRCDRTTITFA